MAEGLCVRGGGPIPLVGVEVDGEVLGGHARVRARQRYVNREARPVEAVYVFPLPSDATITAFSMTCDGRTLVGEVKEREAAFRAYDDAVTAGHGAALLEQERPNVFTANVGNLLPGEETVVEIEYVQRVQVDEGAVRWMIPTLVAPRYIPGAPAGDRTAHGAHAPTDRVPDADRISPPVGAADYRLTMRLVVWAGEDVEVECPSHRVNVQREPGRVTVSFAQHSVALDRDVVVTARGPGARPIAGALSHHDGKTGYCALTIIPDLFDGAARHAPQDVVFVVDRSGSMGGESMPQARAALRLCLRHLREGDQFNIVAFDDEEEWLSPGPVPFTQRTLAHADRWLAAIEARGGTELLAPLVRAVTGRADGVVVLVTDGQIGNEAEVLEAVLAARGAARTRVYSFGIGTNVSDALLRDLGRRTGGGVELIHPGERIDDKVVATFARATAPRVTGVKVRFEGVDVGEIAPGELPALVDGDAWTIFGTYEKPGIGRAEIRGERDGAPFVLEVPVDLTAEGAHPAVAKLWATERIRELEAAAATGRRAEAMRDRIVKLAVEHGVSSKLTSFVVVEKRAGDRRAQGLPETRVIPVSAPAGWDMFQGADATPTGFSQTRAGTLRRSPTPSSMSHAMPGAGPPKGGPLPRPAPAQGLLAKAKQAIFGGGDDMDDEAADLPNIGAPAPAEAELEERTRVAMDPEDLAEALGTSPAPEPDGGSELVALLSRQLASGLWDDPQIGGPEPARQARATVRALLELFRADITTAHVVYGAQVRKAIEALLPLLGGLVASEPRLVELCIVVAYLASSGRRTRGAVEAVVDRLGARDKLGDEATLRGKLDQLAASA